MTNFTVFKLKEFADDNFELGENEQKVLKKGKTRCGKKEKLHVTSNFFFSHCVFKRRVLQTRKTKGLFGEELRSRRFLQFRTL